MAKKTAARKAAARLASAAAPLNVVVDLSHHNHDPDLARAKGAWIVGVIHKATQVVHYVDPTYGDHHTAAVDHDLMRGAAHF